MARRSDHSRDEIRTMALVAAEGLIAEQGFSGLSARKVAAAIGYTVGTLYLVFRNLDDLILQVNERTLDALFSCLQEALEASAEGEGALALGLAYLHFATEAPRRWGAVFDHHLPEGEVPPPGYLAKVERFFTLLEGVLRGLAPARSDAEIARAARALWSGVHGVCILGLTGRLDPVSGGELELLVASLVRNYLAGFTGR